VVRIRVHLPGLNLGAGSSRNQASAWRFVAKLRYPLIFSNART